MEGVDRRFCRLWGGSNTTRGAQLCRYLQTQDLEGGKGGSHKKVLLSFVNFDYPQ